jgi:hypothetical protein
MEKRGQAPDKGRTGPRQGDTAQKRGQAPTKGYDPRKGTGPRQKGDRPRQKGQAAERQHNGSRASLSPERGLEAQGFNRF